MLVGRTFAAASRTCRLICSGVALRCGGLASAYQRQRHMPGRWFSTAARRLLEYESLLERDWMLLLDFDRDVEAICEQPLRLRYREDGKPASHVPDLLVWRAGSPELCDVKSAERLEHPEFLAQVRAMGWRAPRRGLAIGCWRSLIVSCW